ncbi:MAG: RluA family pseudouridine synthase [Gemmatimonadales bacterium]
MRDPPRGRPPKERASESPEPGLPEVVTFQIEEPHSRLDRHLSERLDISRSRAASLIAQGLVEVDGRAVAKSRAVSPGETVTVALPPKSPIEVGPEAISLGIRYEDDDLAVVEKPAGMVVHPAPGHPGGTLVNALLHHLGHLSSIGAPLRPGIVHRLDRDTSGLLVVARTDEAHRALADAIARRRVRRGYLAAAWGKLAEGEGTIDLPIGRDPRERKRMAVVEGGRRAVTHYRRLERWSSAEYLSVRLETGRTHQVRVHLRALGHPVVGDPIYAPRWERGFVGAGGHWAEEFARRCGRMFLHAAHLVFRHPRTGERMEFTSPLPEPLRAAAQWASRLP